MSVGSDRGARSAKGRRRSAVPSRPHTAAGDLSSFEFRIQVRRPRDGRPLATLQLGGLVTEVTWERPGARTTGSITFRDPEGRDVPGLIATGDVVRLLVRDSPAGAWAAVWEMTASKPVRSIGTERGWTAELSAKLSVAQQTRKAWRYAPDAAHRRGWRADEMVVNAARRMKVPLGTIARGAGPLPRVALKSGSVLDLATKAYRLERREHGRRFDVSIGRGVLDVTELRRPAHVLPLGRMVTDASLGEGIATNFASAVVVTSTTKAKSGGKRRRVRATYVDRDRVRRYGYIEKKVSKAGLTTVAAARRFGQQWLARVASPYTEVTVEHPGIPWVQRGDAFDLRLVRANLRQTVWVKNAAHALSAGRYTMTVTLATDDPWEADERAAKNAKARAATARRRGRQSADTATTTRRVPAKGARRA